MTQNEKVKKQQKKKKKDNKNDKKSITIAKKKRSLKRILLENPKKYKYVIAIDPGEDNFAYATYDMSNNGVIKWEVIKAIKIPKTNKKKNDDTNQDIKVLRTKQSQKSKLSNINQNVIDKFKEFMDSQTFGIPDAYWNDCKKLDVLQDITSNDVDRLGHKRKRSTKVKISTGIRHVAVVIEKPHGGSILNTMVDLIKHYLRTTFNSRSPTIEISESSIKKEYLWSLVRRFTPGFSGKVKLELENALEQAKNASDKGVHRDKVKDKEPAIRLVNWMLDNKKLYDDGSFRTASKKDDLADAIIILLASLGFDPNFNLIETQRNEDVPTEVSKAMQKVSVPIGLQESTLQFLQQPNLHLKSSIPITLNETIITTQQENGKMKQRILTSNMPINNDQLLTSLLPDHIRIKVQQQEQQTKNPDIKKLNKSSSINENSSLQNAKTMHVNQNHSHDNITRTHDNRRNKQNIHLENKLHKPFTTHDLKIKYDKLKFNNKLAELSKELFNDQQKIISYYKPHTDTNISKYKLQHPGLTVRAYNKRKQSFLDKYLDQNVEYKYIRTVIDDINRSPWGSR